MMRRQQQKPLNHPFLEKHVAGIVTGPSPTISSILAILPEDRHTLITSGDWDGDGDPDLLLGSRSGALYAYVNQGGTEDPDWSRLELQHLHRTVVSFSAPSLADLDGDGDLDILVGREDGTLDLLRNEGSKDNPDWQMAEVRFAKIDIGSRSTPLIRDLDGDSDLDLLVGNSQGFLVYLKIRKH